MGYQQEDADCFHAAQDSVSEGTAAGVGIAAGIAAGLLSGGSGAVATPAIIKALAGGFGVSTGAVAMGAGALAGGASSMATKRLISGVPQSELDKYPPHMLDLLMEMDLESMVEVWKFEQQERARYLVRLTSPSSQERIDGVSEIAAELKYDLKRDLIGMLTDDAPYLFQHGEKVMVAEVRAQVLAALERMYRRASSKPDFGPVLVTRALKKEDVFLLSEGALNQKTDAEQKALLSEARQWVQAHVQPAKKDLLLTICYRVLQLLSLIPYKREEVDPVTFPTPTQEEIRISQTVRQETPKGAWVFDFAECDEACQADEWLRRAMDFSKKGVPKIARDRHGEPIRQKNLAWKHDGIVPFNTDKPVDLLSSLEIQLRDARSQYDFYVQLIQ